jgi:hypothetical protein
MFSRTKELLRKLEERQNALEAHVKALPDALAEALQKKPAQADGVGALIESFGKAFGSLAESSARTNESISSLMSDALERANKVAIRSASRELSDKSREVREERKSKIRQLPPWVAKCEECLALLHERAPKHANDVLRHATEKHVEQLSAFRDQLELPMGGARA